MGKLEKKTVNSTMAESNLKEELKVAQDNLLLQMKNIYSIRRRILEEEFKPFKIGDHVLMEVAQGRTKRERECILSIDEFDEFVIDGFPSFRATPIKEDGSLSGRSFIVGSPSMLKSI